MLFSSVGLSSFHNRGLRQVQRNCSIPSTLGSMYVKVRRRDWYLDGRRGAMGKIA